MNQDLQSVLAILAMGAVAWLVMVIVMIICFNFPAKCEKCGKFTARKLMRIRSEYFKTSRGVIHNEAEFIRKRCSNCGYISKEKYQSSFATLIPKKDPLPGPGPF
jgi:predicted nucleic-acid-binding Zn-ribbon protein